MSHSIAGLWVGYADAEVAPGGAPVDLCEHGLRPGQVGAPLFDAVQATIDSVRHVDDVVLISQIVKCEPFPELAGNQQRDPRLGRHIWLGNKVAEH